MGIYDSRMSLWQRRKAGLPQDNAGKTKEEPVVEKKGDLESKNNEVAVEATATKEVVKDSLETKKPSKFASLRTKKSKAKGKKKGES